jgi:hypothetical protein
MGADIKPVRRLLITDSFDNIELSFPRRRPKNNFPICRALSKPEAQVLMLRQQC